MEYCQACRRQAPTRYVEFYQNIGMLVMRSMRAVKGHLCKRCVKRYFWQMTGLTLVTGGYDQGIRFWNIADGKETRLLKGHNGGVFGLGHNAAAVISSAFFCREHRLDADTQKEILAYLDARLLKNPIYETPRPKEKADPKLAQTDLG